jgi:predicted nucleic acid-binding protein
MGGDKLRNEPKKSFVFSRTLLRSRGRRRASPGDLRDAMIAGIALAHHGTLATRNAAHLENVRFTIVKPCAP